MIRQRLKISIFFLFLFIGLCHAESPAYRFKHLTTDQGLSASFITCIAKDRHGYMWFGSYDGLNKFDGYEFQVYRNKSNDPKSLSGNAILSLFEDRSGRLWIGTQAALDLYDRATDSFSHFCVQKGVRMTVTDIAETPTGELLVIASDQIFTVRWSDSTCVPYPPEKLERYLRDLPGLRRLLLDRDGLLWLIMEANGIVRFDPYTMEIKHYSTSQRHQHGLASDRIMDLAEDRSGRLWVATKDGLYVYEKKTDHFTEAKNIFLKTQWLSNDNCFCIFVDADDNLWVGTSQGGLNLLPHQGESYDRRGFQHFVHDPHDAFSLNNNSIQTIFVDEQKNLWVGTLKGVSFAQNESKSFDTFRHEPNRPHTLSENAVTSFCESKGGNIWIGTDGGGVNYFERRTARFTAYRFNPGNPHSLRSDAILAIHEDARGRVWVGGYLAGLSLLDQSRRRFSHILHSKAGRFPIKNDDVRDIYEDRHGDIWVATNGDGVFQFVQGDPANYHHYRSDPRDIEHSLRNNHCLVVLEDSTGMLWIGTYNGLSMFDRQRSLWTNYSADGPDSSHLSNNWIYCLCEDRQRRLWVGTAKGLNLLNRQTQTFRTFGVQDGLPGDIINGIVEDNQGCLWISTNNGLAKFNPEDHSVSVYTVPDGLQGNEYIHGAYAKLSNGEILFGGTNGFSLFQPEKVRTNVRFPHVTLTRIRILSQVDKSGADTPAPFEKMISDASELVLTYKQARIFTLFYSALEYSSPGKIRYRYLLEGYHDNWIDAASNRSATIMNLNPGRYTFRVTASNNEGVWSEKSASIHLRILPPWWRTWYACLAYGLLIIFMIWGYHLYSLKLMRLRMDLQAQKLEMEKAHELEALKSRFFTNISHEFRTPLTLILVPLVDLIKRGRDKDWPQILDQFHLMKRSAERLLRLVNQVIDFNKIESGKLELTKKEIDIVKFTKDIVETFTPMAADKHITLQFGSNRVSCYALVDPDKIDIVIFNLLSNAFKFTPEHGEIAVTVKQSVDSHVEICVSDTGPGVPVEHIDHIFDRFYHVNHPISRVRQGAGIGLSLSKELVELHQGKISVQSENGKGACFLVRLPVGEISIHDHHEQAMVSSDEEINSETGDDGFFSDAHDAERPAVLIVEDDGDLRDYLKSELKESYHILTATNGQAGLKLALETIPDLIVSDIMMFEMDGIEFCKQIRTNHLTSHIPVLLLTARSAEADHLEGLEIGADDYITKPFSLDILKMRIRNLLESRRRLRERFSREVRVMPKDIVITSLDEQFLERAISTVEAHLADQNFDVQAFSHLMGLSRAQLFRKLKALTAETPVEFIQTIRLKRAAQLLTTSQLNVAEICFEVGFNYPSHFARLFHAQFGVSPKEYRRQNWKEIKKSSRSD
ncbi:MAG: ATP-binding protein [candidate division KSB1 bacterium]|nr:ATP-binding protein [candidate division KSB1 bacterium]MDZ7305245.1 ATP-binding protein [candidate division KSB1 bacterium]MDZ7310663.1 ATP-binding protein [candidate division KSB1 bacterium]